MANDEERAYHSVLKVMVLDKNYIDTATLASLQPALDYYLKKGTPDERMKTYYYEGRIFQNNGDDGQALLSYIKAREQGKGISDSLTLARALVAQASIYYEMYDIEKFIYNNLQAAEIYRDLGRDDRKIAALAKAFSGASLIENKHLADSIGVICESLADEDANANEYLLPYFLINALTFGNDEAIANSIEAMMPLDSLTDEAKLDVANGYMVLKEYKKADRLLETVDTTSHIAHTLKFYATKTDIKAAIGDYKGAYIAYLDYSTRLEATHESIFESDLLSVEDKHRLEIEKIQEKENRHKTIFIAIIASVLLIASISVLVYRLRLIQAKRALETAEKDRLIEKNDRLRQEKENLQLREEYLHIENEQQKLLAENLQHQLYEAENEKTRLEDVLKNSGELSGDIVDIVRKRLEMLNATLARDLSENERYAKPYVRWIKSIKDNKKKFMDDTRMAYTISHPKFICYLRERGLTDEEVNYICLYAIGLNGKDAGNFIQLRRHYNLSSDIRKKLGLKANDTTVALIVKELLNMG